MNKKIKNYLQFIISLIIMGFGIALVTKSDLGTSAISSLPYVLSRIFDLSFGMFTLLINTFYFLIQWIVLNKNFPKTQYLQIVVGPILGLFIDVSMYLLRNLNNVNYLMQLSVLLAGCVVIGFSIWLQLAANVVTNPTEGMVKLISDKTRQEFSKVKIIFDIFLVVLSASISIIALGKIVGIREGTLISAIAVGYVIRGINYLEEKLKGGK